MKKKNDKLKIDARAIGAEGQHAKRLDVIRLYLEKTYSGPQIAKILGVTHKYVYDIIRLYDEGGLDALKIKKRGRTPGTKRTLTCVQENEIKNTLLSQTPENFDIPETLWTLKNIQVMIKSKFNIDLPGSTLSDYLKRWDYTSQRPIKRAVKQSPEKIDEWINFTYVEIRKRALEEKAEILFGDETTVKNTTGYMRGYAPKGQPPIVRVDTKKLKVNMISAISQKGKLRFMLTLDNFNAKTFLIFLQRLVIDRVNRDGYKKVFLIVDNAKFHHAKIVRKWLEEHKRKIEIFFLPPYAPEYNPDELLNSYLKQGLGKSSYSCEKQLKGDACYFLAKLRNFKQIVSSFFQSLYTAYAS